MGRGLVVQAHGRGGGRQKYTCFITRAIMGSPHTPRHPQVPRVLPITLFLLLLKFAAFALKKILRAEKKWLSFFF